MVDLDAWLGGEFSNRVCESTDWAEKLLVRATACCCEVDDSAGGDSLRCDAGRWTGNEAMSASRFESVREGRVRAGGL